MTRTQVTTDVYTYTVIAANQETFIFTNTGRLLTHVDPLGHQTTLSYTDGITLSRVTGPGGGRWLAFDHDSQGRLITVSDHTGRSVRYGYDTTGDLTVVTDTLAQAWTYVYSGTTHLLHEVVEPGLDGRVVERTFYDDDGRAVRQEDGLDNLVVGINYGLTYSRLVTDAGRVTTDTYTVGNVLISQTDELGNGPHYTSDSYLNRDSDTDANGNTTRYGRTRSGMVTSIIDALGNRTTLDYNSTNNPTRTVQAAGTASAITTTYAYEDADFPTFMTDTLGNTWHYTATDDGLLWTEKDPLGSLTVYGYDDHGQVTMTVRASETSDAITTTFDYDNLGRLITTTRYLDGVAIKDVTRYNAADRPITTTQNYVTGVCGGTASDQDVCTVYGCDPAGRLVTTTRYLDGTPIMDVSQYDAAGRLIASIRNYQDGTYAEANPDEDLVTQYGYDDYGRQILVTDTLEVATRTFYDDLGRMEATVANWDPATLSSPTGCVLSPTNHSDENLCTLYGYDPAGNQITTTNAAGQTTLTVYDALNRPIISVANWDGMTIDEPGDCDFSDPDQTENLCTITAYDALGRRIAVTDPMSNTTEYGYDPLGRLITTTRYLEGGVPVTAVVSYDALGNRISETDAEGNTTTYSYDDLSRLETTVSAEGVTITRTYDALGRAVATTNDLGHTTVYTYDALGRQVAVADPEGNTTRYGYDALGNRAVITDANGIVTHYGYDPAGRLITVTENVTTTTGQGCNVVTRYSYDALGNLTVVTDALNHATTYAYDALGRQTAATDPEGNTTHYAYNPLGLHLVVTDALTQTTVYTYDALNHLVAIGYYTPTLQSTVEFAYDRVGNRTIMTDSVGTTRTGYDDLYRPITVTDPFSGTVIYGYDLVGNRTQLTYPAPSAGSGQGGEVVTYTFDNDNRLSAVTDWDGGLTAYDYDTAGQLITTTLPNGITTTFRYDDAGRLEVINHEGLYWTLATYTYTLDGVGNRLGVVEVLHGPTPHSYEPLVMKNYSETVESMMSGPGAELMPGPLLSPLPVPAPESGTLLSPLPPPGEATDGSTPSGGHPIPPALAWLLVAVLLVVGVISLRNRQREWVAPAAFVLAVVVAGAGLTLRGGSAAPPSAVPSTLLSPGGDPPPGGDNCAYPEPVEGGRAIHYSYDGLGRLVEAAYGTGLCYQYRYDQAGNREAMTTTTTLGSTSAVTYTYDTANRLTHVGGITVTWDNAGNLLEDQDGTVYTYDVANRLTGVAQDGITYAFQYRCMGLSRGIPDCLRVTQSVNGEVMTYTWDLAAPLPQVLATTDGASYIRGLDLVAEERSGTWAYPLGDALGSVRQWTDDDGYVTYAGSYTPYGVEASTAGTTASAWGYTGEWEDDTGLIYLRARHLDPQSGRFVTRDPWEGDVWEPSTLHAYVYVGNDPVNRVDPSGTDWEDAGIGRQIHQMIQTHYLANYAGGRVVRAEYRIEDASKEDSDYQITPDGSIIRVRFRWSGTWGRADLADLTSRQLYEIKPIGSALYGAADVAWYLSFLPGWTPGTVYSPAPVRIGPSPGDPTKDLYAELTLPGVIGYWERLRGEPIPVPVPVPEWERERERVRVPVVRTCGIIVAVGATVVILINPLVGDEALLPWIWSLVASGA